VNLRFAQENIHQVGQVYIGEHVLRKVNLSKRIRQKQRLWEGESFNRKKGKKSKQIKREAHNTRVLSWNKMRVDTLRVKFSKCPRIRKKKV